MLERTEPAAKTYQEADSLKGRYKRFGQKIGQGPEIGHAVADGLEGGLNRRLHTPFDDPHPRDPAAESHRPED